MDLRTAVSLLPTPAVNDMGAGKTVEQWDSWTQRMREEHRNGNGHGKSLAIEALRLLPTPMARDWKDTGNFTPRPEKSKLPHTIASLGATTSPRSSDGPESSDGQPPNQLNLDATAHRACPPGSSSG